MKVIDAKIADAEKRFKNGKKVLEDQLEKDKVELEKKLVNEIIGKIL